MIAPASRARGDASPSPEVSFRHAAQAFDQASSLDRRVHEWRVTVAGQCVHVRCVGRTLANRLIRALPHAAGKTASDDPVALSLDLWDELDTRVVVPDRAARELECSPDGRFVRFGLPHVASWLDRTHRRLIASFASADGLAAQDLYQPFGPLFAIWLADRRAPAIHAAAVGLDGRGLLLTGRSGAGKSTTAIACLLAGWDYLGDDFVAISGEGADFDVHGVYGMAHLVASHVPQFPALPVAAVHPPSAPATKAVVDLAGAFPERVAPRARIRAVVLPRITPGGVTALRPASRSAAMLALAPASLFLRGSASPAAFHTMASVVESVPTYWLDMNADLSTIPTVLRPLVEAE